MKYILKPDVTNLVVSRPRTGTTWLQALMGAYLIYAYEIAEDDLVMRSQDLCRANGLPVLAFTHDPQRKLNDPEHSIEADYSGKRVALLLRDPRDALVSAWFMATQRLGQEHELATFIRQTARHYARFYATWLAAQHLALGGFTLVAYEEMHRCPHLVALRLAAFWGYRVDAHVARQAVEFAQFGNMQRLERSGEMLDRLRVPGMNSDAATPVDALRTRQGKVGGYQSVLTAVELDCIRKEFAQHAALAGLWEL